MWIEKTLYQDWQHRYYSSPSALSEEQKREERRQHSSICEEGDLVMQMDGPISGSKLFRVFKTKRDAFNYIMSPGFQEQRFFYETIFDFHRQKPKFDVDISPSQIPDDMMPPEEFHVKALELILSAIQRNVPALDPMNDIAVYQAHGPDKYSYHIVLTGYYVDDNVQAFKFTNQVIKTLEEDSCSSQFDNEKRLFDLVIKCIDTSVYKNLQQFRLLFCTKRGKNRYKKRLLKFSIDGNEYVQEQSDDLFEEFKKSLISCFDVTKQKWLDMSLFISLLMTEEETHQHSLLSLTTTSLWITDVQTVYNHLCDVGHLPKPLSFFSSSISGQDNLIPLRNVPGGYYCDVCSKRHDNENPFIFLKLNKGEVDIMFSCRRNKDGKTKKLCSMVVTSPHEQQEQSSIFTCSWLK